MACVTLKRPLEFDPIHSSPGGSSCSPRPHKRRRCLPMCIPASQVNSPTTSSFNASSFAALPSSHSATRSPFVNAAPALLQGDIAQYVREEIRRLKRRRLLPDNRQRATIVRASMDDEDSSPSQSPPRTTSPPLNHSLLATPALTTAASPASKDKALFTFKQVQQLCEQLLKEREKSIREHYDSVLAHELAEQYSKCVRFTTEQIHQQLAKHDLPSYMS
ncbi:akirin-2 [Hyalella azteca]|uniref:Akirin-2 n=1 Tax=Hyalella azteca TaxID=294128 RepID=A0A8B7NX59_HYAAZ|nr:akirin-2 [Hyalella azteca]